MNNTSKPFEKFILLWPGELVSAIGGGLISFGLSVYVYQQSEMAYNVSFVMLRLFIV
jgi:DHA3 family macrolide efflux protein-like MFS transporter